MRLTFILIYSSLLLLACNNNSVYVSPSPIEGRYIMKADASAKIFSPSILQDSVNFIWGASVIQGQNGKYHMFYSRWNTGEDDLKFSDAWVLNSEIVYAVSDKADRDFKEVKTILKGRMHNGDSLAWDAQAVHNPHIKKFGDKYYLYYIGNRDPGQQEEGNPGWGLNKRNRCQQNQYTGVLAFDNFEELIKGNFIRSAEPLLLPRTRVRSDKKNILFPSPEGTVAKPDNIIIVNPSVEFRPSDAKYLLYFKGNLYDPTWKGIHGVAISDSPEGPFKPLDKFIFDIRTEDGSIASAEDPFVWYHKRHLKFYAIIKDFTGRITGFESGLAILESADGIDWIKSKGTSYLKKEISFTDGTLLELKNMERPQLLLDRVGNPLVLYAACSVEAVGNKRDGSTFNVHIALKIKDKRYLPAGRQER